MDSEDIRSALYRDLKREHGFEPLKVEGRVPDDLVGTLYRNGPGRFGAFGRPYHHLFEGQGAISAVRFGGGAATGAVRRVESAGQRAEDAAGRPLYDSAASRLRRIASRLRGRDKNTANVNVIGWQGRVFALRDVARPIELAPATLETLGESDLEGALVASFTAHPHLVAARGSIYGFGLRYGRASQLDLYELPARGAARRLASLSIPATPIHDFAATDRHLVFLLGPARLNLGAALLGEARAERLVRWDAGAPGEALIVPIDAPERCVRFAIEPFYVWHYANAFERDGEIVVDFVRHPNADATATMRASAARGGGVIDMDEGQLQRARIDPRTGRASFERLFEPRCEFPRVDSRGEGGARRYVWLTAASGPQARSIARVDVERGAVAAWLPERGQHVTEPVFAPRAGGSAEETDGYALTLVYDERRDTSHVAVLNASAPERGPLARVHFDHPVPLTLHGSFVQDARA